MIGNELWAIWSRCFRRTQLFGQFSLTPTHAPAPSNTLIYLLLNYMHDFTTRLVFLPLRSLWIIFIFICLNYWSLISSAPICFPKLKWAVPRPLLSLAVRCSPCQFARPSYCFSRTTVPLSIKRLRPSVRGFRFVQMKSYTPALERLIDWLIDWLNRVLRRIGSILAI